MVALQYFLQSHLPVVVGAEKACLALLLLGLLEVLAAVEVLLAQTLVLEETGIPLLLRHLKVITAQQAFPGVLAAVVELGKMDLLEMVAQPEEMAVMVQHLLFQEHR